MMSVYWGRAVSNNAQLKYWALVRDYLLPIERVGFICIEIVMLRIHLYFYKSKIVVPIPGVEPGPPGWKPGILTARPYGTGALSMGGSHFVHHCPYTCFIIYSRPQTGNCSSSVLELYTCSRKLWRDTYIHINNNLYNFELLLEECAYIQYIYVWMFSNHLIVFSYFWQSFTYKNKMSVCSDKTSRPGSRGRFFIDIKKFIL